METQFSFDEGLSRMKLNINYWSNSKLWTKKNIDKHENWFDIL